MRWMWLDHILELDLGERLVAIKHVSNGGDHLAGHFGPDRKTGEGSLPIMPTSLIIEGMAQAAGVLVAGARDYKEKVILAKIAQCELTEDATSGDTLRYTATLDRIDSLGASARGEVAIRKARSGEFRTIGRIDLMFSHLDNNMSGLRFPEHNFVLGDSFRELLENSGFEAPF